MTKIIVDCYGGDNAPYNMIEGAVIAVSENADLEVILVGKKEEVEPILKEKYQGDKITVINSTEIITNDDVPTVAIKEKADSSMVVALKTLASDGSIDGVVSAGSTGALLTGAFMFVKRIRGIARPALCTITPNLATGGKGIFLDCGANADCKPQYLTQFAMMGSAYLREVCGVENPKVALLSNGTEDSKGNELTKESFILLKEMKGINFVGNTEARDVLSGEYDVVVCDGFSGNIALKSYEGMANSVFYLLKKNLTSFTNKIGALLLKPVLREVKKTLDYSEQGGGIFLGVEKPVVKAHGASKAKTIALAIMQAKSMADNKVVDKIKANLASQLQSEE